MQYDRGSRNSRLRCQVAMSVEKVRFAEGADRNRRLRVVVSPRQGGPPSRRGQRAILFPVQSWEAALTLTCSGVNGLSDLLNNVAAAKGIPLRAITRRPSPTAPPSPARLERARARFAAPRLERVAHCAPRRSHTPKYSPLLQVTPLRRSPDKPATQAASISTPLGHVRMPRAERLSSLPCFRDTCRVGPTRARFVDSSNGGIHTTLARFFVLALRGLRDSVLSGGRSALTPASNPKALIPAPTQPSRAGRRPRESGFVAAFQRAWLQARAASQRTPET